MKGCQQQTFHNAKEGQMLLDDYIVQIFCEVDDFMKERFLARSLRERGPLPQLADSEVLTMEIVGESLGFETDTDIFWFFKTFYGVFFPKLKHRQRFVDQAANLWQVKRSLFDDLAFRFQDTVVVVDSIPLYVCRFARAKRSRLFRGLAAYGKELGNQTFYGFKLHLKINSIGMAQSFDLTPANVHDIKLLPELVEGDSGLGLADRAYLSQELQKELKEAQGLELSVPTKYGQVSELPEAVVRARKKVRRRIETVFSQWEHHFRIKKIWARDLWHLTSRILRKILAHTFSVILCIQQGLRPLHFSKLMAY